jgi:transpeptidase family protein/penicillin-binding protein/MecA-like transpeptidase family protein
VGKAPRSQNGRRRRRAFTRVAPLILLAAGAFAVGIIVATGPGRAERQLVTHYMQAWARGDYGRMYSLLDQGSRRRISQAQFVAAYQAAARTATVLSLATQHIGNRAGDVIPVRMRVTTRVFGPLVAGIDVPLAGSGSSAAVRWTSNLVFPGLRPGEQLGRRVTLPPRATLRASDGTPLAQGPTRSSPIPDVAGQIVGTLGPIQAQDRARYTAAGYPPDAQVGIDGLERVFQDRLAGSPGGTLFAGHRVLARRRPARGHAVTTTIVPALERAAVAAMAGRSAGIAAMNPRTGGVYALAGFAFSALQPPGSTMKMITATAALAAHVVKLSSTFPIQTSANIAGYTLHNANGEACGGTFYNAFAVSCNSVFAPLGVKLGAARLVSMAERFGFNEAPSIPGAAESTIPSAATIGGDVDLGSSAIGQGKVQASALEMTDVGATIAEGGRRPIPTLLAHQHPVFVHVTSHHIAREVQRMMIAVVRFGTGTSAQIPGVTVAGKTGTAELGGNLNTDAWFVGYAPVGHPRVTVGALFPQQGAGGATAAPAVHDVLVAALHVLH